jgi:hypothetical protein
VTFLADTNFADNSTLYGMITYKAAL